MVFSQKFTRGRLFVYYLYDVLPLVVFVLVVVIGIVVVFRFTMQNIVALVGDSPFAYSLLLFTVLLSFTSTFENLIGSLTLLADGILDIGNLVEIRGVTGTLLFIGAMNVQLKQTGRSTINIPSKEFSKEPFITFDEISGYETSVVIHLIRFKDKTFQSDTPENSNRSESILRHIKTQLELFLFYECGMERCKVSFLTTDSLSKSARSNCTKALQETENRIWFPNQPILPTFQLSWYETNLTDEKYMLSRSNTMLALHQFLHSKGIEFL